MYSKILVSIIFIVSINCSQDNNSNNDNGSNALTSKEEVENARVNSDKNGNVEDNSDENKKRNDNNNVSNALKGKSNSKNYDNDNDNEIESLRNQIKEYLNNPNNKLIKILNEVLTKYYSKEHRLTDENGINKFASFCLKNNLSDDIIRKQLSLENSQNTIKNPSSIIYFDGLNLPGIEPDIIENVKKRLIFYFYKEVFDSIDRGLNDGLDLTHSDSFLEPGINVLKRDIKKYRDHENIYKKIDEKIKNGSCVYCNKASIDKNLNISNQIYYIYVDCCGAITHGECYDAMWKDFHENNKFTDVHCMECNKQGKEIPKIHCFDLYRRGTYKL